jgi:hypothetical protein
MNVQFAICLAALVVTGCGTSVKVVPSKGTEFDAFWLNEDQSKRMEVHGATSKEYWYSSKGFSEGEFRKKTRDGTLAIDIKQRGAKLHLVAAPGTIGVRAKSDGSALEATPIP